MDGALGSADFDGVAFFVAEKGFAEGRFVGDEAAGRVGFGDTNNDEFFSTFARINFQRRADGNHTALAFAARNDDGVFEDLTDFFNAAFID